MPSIIADGSFFVEIEVNKEKSFIEVKKPDLIPSKADAAVSTTPKRRLRSERKQEGDLISTPPNVCSATNCKTPRRSINGSPNSEANGICRALESRLALATPKKNLLESFPQKSKWNPEDSEQMRVVKEALHLSTEPSAVVCRDEEQRRVLEFCKGCIEQDRSGSLYICGCPGTGKSLSMEKVKKQLKGWAEEEERQVPDVLTMICTSLTNTKEIFNKILEMYNPEKKIAGASSALEQLQKLFSQKQSSGKKLMLIVADELDYLITRDRSVLHDLFMLTTLPYSRCILVGIANAIDLADRFLPKLQSLNCKPIVVTFRAYTKDQILKILQQRLEALPYDVFQSQALELCARKVAAASGDMRKALCVSRSAIDVFETALRDNSSNCSTETVSAGQPVFPTEKPKQEINIVKVDHMAVALSKAFKSGMVDIIQSLPQHQQMILCSIVKLFRKGKKDTTVGEMNKSYLEISKSAQIPPVGTLEFMNMCEVLTGQGLLKLGTSREDRLKRVTLKVDEADIIFALQGVRLFRKCLQ